MHDLCIFWFVQKSVLTKNYFLTAEKNMITRGPLYTCLVVFTITEIIQGQKIFLTRPKLSEKNGLKSWWLSFWPPSIWGPKIALRVQFVYLLHADPYINFKLNANQRKFRITSLLFPETDFQKPCRATFANFETIFKNWFGHKIQTIIDMTKIFCKVTLGVHMSKIYQFVQNLRGPLHDTVWFLEKMSQYENGKSCMKTDT